MTGFIFMLFTNFIHESEKIIMKHVVLRIIFVFLVCLIFLFIFNKMIISSLLKNKNMIHEKINILNDSIKNKKESIQKIRKFMKNKKIDDSLNFDHFSMIYSTDLFSIISKMAKDSRIFLISVNPMPHESRDGFVLNSIRANLEGSFQELLIFLTEISRKNLNLFFENCRFRASSESQNHPVQMTIDLISYDDQNV